MESKDNVYLCIECNQPILKDPRSKALRSTRFHHGCRIKYEQRTEFNKCECGCGSVIPKLSKHRGSPLRFKLGHHMRGERNNHWRGDDVGYYDLHRWVRRWLPQPELCEMCNVNKSRDLANITRIYNREFKNWQYLCKLCHNTFDAMRLGFKRKRKKLLNP